MRYWSTTHKQWQTLDRGFPRRDRLAAQSTPARTSRPMRCRKARCSTLNRPIISPARPTTECTCGGFGGSAVFDIENVSVMRYLFLTLFSPGEMQSIYFLDRESDDVWRYLRHRPHRTKRQPAGHGAGTLRLLRSTAPLRSIAPWSGFHRPGASGGAMNFSARSLRGCSRLGRLPWRRGAVAFWWAPPSSRPLWRRAQFTTSISDRANLPDLEAFSRV